MNKPLRYFNKKGIEAFHDYLRQLRDDPYKIPPFALLDDERCYVEVGGDRIIEDRTFSTRLEAAKYIYELFPETLQTSAEHMIGLWCWLSLFYFDQVCPTNAEGERAPGRDYRHILDLSYRYRHRHLLAGPYQVYQDYQEKALLLLLLLCTPLNKENTFHHELAGRQILMSNPAIIEAAHILYLDSKNYKPKPGAQSNGKPGTLRRFVDVIQQLDLTYDLYSMDHEEILSLLPEEFDNWKSG